MKRYIAILFFIILTTCTKIITFEASAQTTYYVSPTTASPAGNNANAGTIAAPWATLSYAISQVTTADDTIRVNAGTYPAIPTQMLLSNRVSLIGAGDDVVTIPLTYSAGTPCIKLETWGGWANKSTVGHQIITGIKFVGSTTPGTPVGRCAIGVNFRNYVEVYDCTFEDFVYQAVWFKGEPTYNIKVSDGRIDNPYEGRVGEDSQYLPFADSFCEGNKFYNNVVHNSCGWISATMYSGELEVATQDGMLIYGNYMTATGRSGNANGVPIKLIGDVGFNRNTKIYSNSLYAGHKSTNYWQFAIEIWWDLGGLEIYNNYCEGAIDLCDSWDQYGAGYGAKIYDNEIGYPSSTGEWEPGIRLENSHLDTYIFRNYFHNISIGIEVNNNNVTSGATVTNGVYIYDNLMVELKGQAYQTWGIYWNASIIDHPNLWRNIYIQHNTIIASASAPDPTYYGVMLPTVQDFDGFYVENNILINWERGAVYGSGTRTQATNIFIRNNLIYDSYNSNDPVYVSSYPTAGITYSGTVKADPSFVSSTDWHLSGTSSPAYHAGRDLAIATDYDEVAFHATTPSIGAYEWPEGGDPEPDPEIPAYGKKVKYPGGMTVKFPGGKTVVW